MFNLRKAHKLQDNLREVKRDLLRLDSEIDVMTKTNWQERLSVLNSQHREKIEAEIAIDDVITEIRNAISVTNSKVGINLILGEMQGLDRKISRYELAALETLREDDDVVEKQIEMKKIELEKNERIFHHTNSVMVSPFDEKWRNDMLASVKKLKKERRDLEDKLQDMNTSAKIELSPSALALLAKYDLD